MNELNLIEVNDEDIEFPSITFDTIIVLSSHEFNKLCREMYNIGETVEIKNSGGQLIFTCNGEFATQETIMNIGENGLTYNKENNSRQIIQGFFNLKNLVSLSKCTNLCLNIELFLKNDYPLLIQFKVADLGTLKVILAPKTTD